MSTYYCVDPGTASGRFHDVPPEPFDYALRVPRYNKVTFWHLNSCLGVDLVLKSGDQIAGHMALQMGGEETPVDADGNATHLINEMGNLLKAGDVIEHVVLIYDRPQPDGMWGTDGVWNQILAKNGRAPAPSRLNVEYLEWGGSIDVTVSADVVTTDGYAYNKGTVKNPDMVGAKRGKSFFVSENATKHPWA